MENRRSRRLETPSPESETNDTQVETTNSGKVTFTDSKISLQEKITWKLS